MFVLHSVPPVNDEAHRHYTPGLKECITAVRPQTIGCEAAHFFPTDIDICTSSDRKTIGPIEETTTQVSGVELEKNHRSNSTRRGGGTLVIHIRSGDIFVKPHHSYGQVRSVCEHQSSGGGRYQYKFKDMRRV